MTLITTTHVHSADTTYLPTLIDQWQTASRKRYRTTDDRETPKAKKTDYWLGETIITNNRFSVLTDETLGDSPNQRTDPKPPPIFISGVANIKPFIELLNALAPNKYLVKTLSNYQVRVQPTESTVNIAIIKALLKKKTRNSTLTNHGKTEALV
jgi:hypothetical protein